jgi:hypothetical protein
VVTESNQINISSFEKLGRMRIKSTVLINKISTLTDHFFITHSRDATDVEWSNLIDQIVDVVNTHRN